MDSPTRKYDENPKEPCQYGSSCYRKNKEHLEKFKHPPKEKQQEKDCADKGNLKQQKLNVFFKRDREAPKRKRKESEEKKDETEQPSCSSESSEIKESVVKEVQRELTPETDEDSESKTNSISSEINEQECEKIIKKLFLVNMPKDFYDFWKFCKSLSPRNPRDALDAVDLQLVGPFDVLTGLIDESMNSSAALRHWRYYYDPPEFQTVLRSTKADSFHVGYFRDETDSLPVFLASNFATRNATISPIAENLFGAIDWCLKESEITATPFKKVKSCNFKTELHNWAKRHEYSLDRCTEKMRARDRKVITRTFHHAGIVVPYDKKTELGYRPLAETSSNLTKLLKQIDNSKTEDERKIYFSKLYEIVTWANIAMDEGDYGTCLELGIDLFSYGSQHLHKIILQLLTPAYNLLNRPAFATILKAHLDDRKKGNLLSALTR